MALFIKYLGGTSYIMKQLNLLSSIYKEEGSPRWHETSSNAWLSRKAKEKMNVLSRVPWKADHYIKSPTRTEEVVQWGKPLLLKREEWCLAPQNSGKHLVGAAATCQLRTREAEGRSPWSKLADGTSWPWWTLGSQRDPTLLNQTDCNWGRHQGPLWASTGLWTCVLLYLHTCMHPYI